MRVALFYHSLVSDWNNGHAHFLRGLTAELLARGHDVRVFEPADAWSLKNLIAENGPRAAGEFARRFPRLRSLRYSPARLDLDRMLDGVRLVLVHEWNDPRIVHRIGCHRLRNRGYRLLFHDSHHRAYSHPDQIEAFRLDRFDGVLAYGDAIRRIYVDRGWGRRAWTWHEAADVRVFRPRRGLRPAGDLVWIGNWGDEERTAEYEEFLLGPARALRLRARAYGVRYPEEGLARLRAARVEYGGWLANYKVPEAYGRFKMTVHIPRRLYATALPGIPTIRPFEAMACGIPMISAPWQDVEGLFTPGEDFLVARDGREMRRHMRRLLNDADLRAELAARGRRTILGRHTCAHRVRELMAIAAELGIETDPTGRTTLRSSTAARRGAQTVPSRSSTTARDGALPTVIRAFAREEED